MVCDDETYEKLVPEDRVVFRHCDTRGEFAEKSKTARAITSPESARRGATSWVLCPTRSARAKTLSARPTAAGSSAPRGDARRRALTEHARPRPRPLTYPSHGHIVPAPPGRGCLATRKPPPPST